jgi:hypothetical protein
MPFILMLIQERKREHQQKLQAIYDTYTHSDPFLIEKYSKSIFIVFGRNIFYCKTISVFVIIYCLWKKTC